MSEQTKPVDQMSDRELQRAIAALRGWTGIFHSASGNLMGFHPHHPQAPRQCIPNWPQDTHAAVVDLLAECEGAKLVWWFGDWDAYFPVTALTDKASIAEHKHPARAICEAWVIWKRGQ